LCDTYLKFKVMSAMASDHSTENPYKPTPHRHGRKRFKLVGRPREAVIYVVLAYLTNILVLWGVACFHAAQRTFELKASFKAIFESYGATGLLCVAVVYAVIPAVGCALVELLAAQCIRSDRAWSRVVDTLRPASLSVSLAADVVLGFSLFTNG
jgi:hypothetical protein